jgi:hypothetical protein
LAIEAAATLMEIDILFMKGAAAGSSRRDILLLREAAAAVKYINQSVWVRSGRCSQKMMKYFVKGAAALSRIFSEKGSCKLNQINTALS